MVFDNHGSEADCSWSHSHIASTASNQESLNIKNPVDTSAEEAPGGYPQSPVSHGDMLDMLAMVATETSRDSLSDHESYGAGRSSPTSQDLDQESDLDSDKDSQLEGRVLLSPIQYKCGYCGRIKTSLSTGQDGRVRIRCECGGKHNDSNPRMHAMWHRHESKRSRSNHVEGSARSGSMASKALDIYFDENQRDNLAFSQLRKRAKRIHLMQERRQQRERTLTIGA